MAVVVIVEWPGVTPEQYEEARGRIGWERNVPDGGIFHVARFSGESMHIVDVWESAEQFETFARDRLLPVTQELGIEGEPQIEIEPAHAYFNPAEQTVRA
jgi:hypothetical protein